MTALLCLVALTVGAGGGWWGCARWHARLREDRRWHELDSWQHRDAAWQLTAQLQRRHATLRYLARLPQPRRVKVMSRYCRLVKETAP